MVGADFVPAEGYGDPLRGMMALLRLARAQGVRLLRGAEVFDRTNRRRVVRNDQKGSVTAGRVVNARAPGRPAWGGWLVWTCPLPERCSR